MKPIGPSFASEIVRAGLAGQAFSWTPDGNLIFDAEATQELKDAVAAVLDAHDPTLPEPEPIPKSVTRYQARAALLEADLLDAVNAYFDSPDASPMARLAWQEAPTVNFGSEAVSEASAALGLTQAQIEALFRRAVQFV